MFAPYRLAVLPLFALDRKRPVSGTRLTLTTEVFMLPVLCQPLKELHSVPFEVFLLSVLRRAKFEVKIQCIATKFLANTSEFGSFYIFIFLQFIPPPQPVLHTSVIKSSGNMSESLIWRKVAGIFA